MKATLSLPQTTFPIKADLPANESIRFNSWFENKVYSRFLRNGENPFILHDGPPYANGDIHIGHALNKILKDFAVKVQYFNGRAVEFVPGWDCHGLPIEQAVSSQIDIKSKTSHEIVQLCRVYAAEQISKQKQQFKSLGIIADWDNNYETMSPSFELMISNKLSELRDKGLLVRRRKPVYWSWAFESALAEAEVEYRERTDESVYIVFKTNKFPWGLLVWTTTPWTLPANVAVALSPNLEYVAVHVKEQKLPVLVAKTLVESLKEKGIVEKVVDNYQVKAEELQGWEFEHPIYSNQMVPCVSADFVTADSGTGIVHIAPGHGEEDYLVGLKNNLPIVMPVGPDARYTEGKYNGELIFDKKEDYRSNRNIINDLKEKGLLVHTEYVTHNYPYCARSNTPIIFRATEQWFFDLGQVRDKVLDSLSDVEFFPETASNRMVPMLKNRPDWCISRQRLWGVPIFEGPDILDVWFDSGLTYNTLNGRKADVYFEGNDQHRGWFQSSLWLSVALTGNAPYKKVLTHGFVLDSKGHKMSKSKKNVVSPNDVVKKHGVEVLRYWAASIDYTKDVSIGDDILTRAAEGHKKLRNTFRFMLSNMNHEPMPLSDLPLPVDRWVMNTAAKVFMEVHEYFENYEYYKGLHKLTEFVNVDLNAIYFNAVKDRLYCDPVDSHSRNSVIHTLKFLLENMLALVAPLFTYTADEVFSHSPTWFKSDRKDIFDFTYSLSQYNPHKDCIEEDYWKMMLEIFHVEFDKLKSTKIVKDTLEVFIECCVNSPKHQFFEKAEDWFVVSGVMSTKSDLQTLAEFTVQGDVYRIVKSPKVKCERCWKRNAEKDLCERCQFFALQPQK